MSTPLLCFIAITLSQNVQSELITCNDASGSCSWPCDANDHCEGNTYHCPPTASSCTLSCAKCDNIYINTFAANFTILCTKNKACSNMHIAGRTNTSNVALHCGSTYCHSIALFCPSQSAICQCFDSGTSDICDDEVHIFSSYSPSMHPTQSPTVRPTDNLIAIQETIFYFSTTEIMDILFKTEEQQNDNTLTFIWMAGSFFFTGCIILAVVVGLYAKCKSKPNRLIIDTQIKIKPIAKESVILQGVEQSVLSNNEMGLKNEDVAEEKEKVSDLSQSQDNDAMSEDEEQNNDDAMSQATLEHLEGDRGIYVDEIRLCEDKALPALPSSLTGEKSHGADVDEKVLENVWNNESLATEFHL